MRAAMNFLRNHWYDLGIIPAAVAALFLAANWQGTDTLLKLALLNYVVIFWHQFEEYRLPGGEPAITNLASQPSDDGPQDRYPLNQANAFFMNAMGSYVLYFLPVLFPHVLWLGFAPVVFGMSQVIIHVIITPRQIGNHVYSPGAGAVVLGHLPVGVCWFVYLIANGLLGWLDVVLGIVVLAAFIRGVMLGIGYGTMKDPQSPYPFLTSEFERGGYAERIRASRRAEATGGGSDHQRV